MKAALLLFTAFIFWGSYLFAQDDDMPPPSGNPSPPSADAPIPRPRQDDSPLLTRYAKANQQRFIIEPDIDAGFSDGGFNIGLAPSVGHKIWKGLYAGAGAVYLYSGIKNVALTEISGQTYYTSAYRQTYGGGVFIQYNIWKGLYIRARFDLLHREIDDLDKASVVTNARTGQRQINMPRLSMNIPDLPIGIGYNVLVSKKLFLPIQLSYNLLYPFLNKQYTVYPDGWIVKLCVFNIF